MKKIVWSFMTIGAMFFVTQNMQAQEGEMEMESEMEMEVEVVNDEFTSIEVAALPQTVKDAIMTEYNDATVSEAWVKSKDDGMVYKVKLDIKGELKKVYIDQDGNWLDKTEKEEE